MNLQANYQCHYTAMFEDFEQKYLWKKSKPNEEFKTDKKLQYLGQK